ncbi:hypothetical protein ECZU08_00100 [Escherichia coli]|nr:hypothetical protein ECZU08_00100 [Escherichia coli]
MARGIWVSPDEFVAFSEPQKSLTAQIAPQPRDRLYGLGMYLPNPDPILKAQGRDIRIYRELRTDPLVGGCIRRRSAQIAGAWTGARSRFCPGLPFHPRHARRSGSVPHHR